MIQVLNVHQDKNRLKSSKGSGVGGGPNVSLRDLLSPSYRNDQQPAAAYPLAAQQPAKKIRGSNTNHLDSEEADGSGNRVSNSMVADDHVGGGAGKTVMGRSGGDCGDSMDN